MADLLLNLARLTRPLSSVKNIAVVSLALYLSSSQLNLGLFILGVFSLSLTFSATYAYNSVCDMAADEENENKKRYFYSVQYFGKNKALAIAVVLAIIALVVGFLINIYFFASLIVLLIISFLYSSPYTRFKEKIIVDVVFGASLTFLFRFVAAWLIFENSFPPLLPMFALVFVKNGGYMLYKGYDKPFLIKRGVKNTTTLLSQKTTLIISAVFFILSILFFLLLCLNSIYSNIDILGSLPISFLWLLPFFIPPIIVSYLLFLKKIKISSRRLRVAGFILLLLLITAVLLTTKQ